MPRRVEQKTLRQIVGLTHHLPQEITVMIGKLGKVIWVLAGLFCLLALADHWGWTGLLWQKALPEVVLTRRPSPRETQVDQLDERIDALKRQIAYIEQTRASSMEKRDDLLTQLRDRIRSDGSEEEAEWIMKNDPVAAALVRSLDAEDQRLIELRCYLIERRKNLTKLEARLIALRNGVSQVSPAELAKPSDELRTENSGETNYDRYLRIIREVGN